VRHEASRGERVGQVSQRREQDDAGVIAKTVAPKRAGSLLSIRGQFGLKSERQVVRVGNRYAGVEPLRNSSWRSGIAFACPAV